MAHRKGPPLPGLLKLAVWGESVCLSTGMHMHSSIAWFKAVSERPQQTGGFAVSSQPG